MVVLFVARLGLGLRVDPRGFRLGLPAAPPPASPCGSGGRVAGGAPAAAGGGVPRLVVPVGKGGEAARAGGASKGMLGTGRMKQIAVSRAAPNHRNRPPRSRNRTKAATRARPTGTAIR